jgi:serine-type D-Ala-D-Ala carboxypeptidase/endopeptidase (penicillin-binding protein 4)
VRIVDWMLQQSDNTIAEVLGRQVAVAAGIPASFAGGATATRAQLSRLGIRADRARLYDASGLSHRNRIPPALLTDLLARAANGRQPALTTIFGGLPVAGWSGTMAKRFGAHRGGRAGRGLVRAKTGTLSGVSTMAGELVTRDGRLLVFAVMTSGWGDAYAAKSAVDRVSARLVACGC